MKNKFLLLLTLTLVISGYTAKSQPKLNSYLSASATIFLDFDGENVNSAVWNSGNPINCLPAPMTDAKITETFNRVAEDYRPFNINITTDSTVFEAAPIAKRIRVIITSTSNWFAGVGGVAYVGSFTWGDDTPCFVFCDRLGNAAKYVAECCSHESGHSLGLSHQSKYDGSCNLTATYNDGAGSGEAAWAPIMGNSYYRNMSGWNNGPTPYGCSNTQDNLTIITTQNGFGYKADDNSDDMNNNPTTINISSLVTKGLISTNTDKDAYTFTLSENSNVLLTINPFNIGANNEGADLDVKVSLYNEAKQLVKIFDPTNSLSVVIDTILLAGKYYMVVDGTGNSNATDYGSLGSYTIEGVTGILPVCSVNLSGSSISNLHKLNWSINCSEGIQSITVQASVNGVNFFTVRDLNGSTTNFMYSATENKNLYYRVKIVSLAGQKAFSNIISISNNITKADSYTVPNMVFNEINIQSSKNYNYVLIDMNGNQLANGKGIIGSTKINTGRYASGMYVLKLINGDQIHTERILKQ